MYLRGTLAFTARLGLAIRGFGTNACWLLLPDRVLRPSHVLASLRWFVWLSPAHNATRSRPAGYHPSRNAVFLLEVSERRANVYAHSRPPAHIDRGMHGQKSKHPTQHMVVGLNTRLNVGCGSLQPRLWLQSSNGPPHWPILDDGSINLPTGSVNADRMLCYQYRFCVCGRKWWVWVRNHSIRGVIRYPSASCFCSQAMSTLVPGVPYKALTRSPQGTQW